MGVEHAIYSLVRFASVDASCQHLLLARATQPSYSNPDQRDEDRATLAGQAELGRVKAAYRASVLAERCPANHHETLLGEAQSDPVGDELYGNAPVRDLPIWVADTRFGPPWLILGTAPSEADFWRAAEADDPRKPARKLVVDFFPGPPTPPGRRIVIKGASGAGKTTLGRALAERLNLPYVELDALHHGPNWTAASAAELQTRVESALDDRRGWVVDGNYEAKLGDFVLDRAELVVWLDLPLSVKLWRLAIRTARRWFRNEELWNGNHESLKAAFWGGEALFPWAVRSHFRARRQWPRKFRGRALVRLRSGRQVRAWFADFCRRA